MSPRQSRFVGADVASLRRFAARLDQAAGDVTRARHSASARVGAVAWTGPDHDQFVDEFNGQCLSTLEALAGELGEAAGVIRWNAHRQAQISQRLR